MKPKIPNTRQFEARPREREERRARVEKSVLTPRQFLLLLGLLILPGIALMKLSQHLDWRILAGYLGVCQLFAFTSVWRDKMRARKEEWRLPENTLHFFELIGGWPSAFLAQRVFRHKTSKYRFQMVTWAIIIGYQLLAAEYISGWWTTRQILALAGA